MIDPKQNAEAIVNLFYNKQVEILNKSGTAPIEKIELQIAIECAKIHVEGIMGALPSSSKNTFKGKSKLSIYEEWQEVLNKLNKM